MPNYDYTCDVCGHAFIAYRPIADRHTSQCPECGGQSVTRQIVPPHVGGGCRISSFAGGVLKSQVPEARETYSDIDGLSIRDDGAVQAKSARALDEYCRRRGFQVNR